MKKLSIATAVLAAATFGLAGCGGDDSSGSGKATKAEYDSMVKFAQCLQKHGVDVDIPAPGQKSGSAPRLANTSDPTWQAAQAACAKLAPNEKNEDTSGADQDHALKMAECLREQGINAKDPAPGTAQLTVEEGADQQKLVAAYTACNKKVPAAS
ncbi:hypothetical protein ETD83_22265 [Actinomadura soli]|uniref:Secreted protein n=1 Tax=Actinomadura soli TaxID=2508997 RepID=A0A5C4J8I0_9ACTN|nr:hypothetical protein [Actinomadura soli]TMQ95633.1 hypothetical protein ETD83_22265 [Actinomadura soli]